MSQQQMTQQQRAQIVAKRLAYIKSECHQAVHPTVIRDRLRELIETLEWLLIGDVSNAQPNVIPGVPAGVHDDPSKVRVEFVSGPGAVAAAQAAVAQIPGYAPDPFVTPIAPPAARVPVNNGDVQFIPGPPPGAPGAVGGQTVEYFGGPGQNGAQRVEFFAGPGAQPPAPPAPVTNQPQQIVPNPPTLTTEAGGHVAPIPGQRPAPGPQTNGGGHNLFPGFPMPPAPPPGAPRTAEEARAVLPIPIAE